MKKVSVTLLVLASVWTCQANAFGLPPVAASLGGGDSGAKVDTGALNANGAKLFLKVGKASALIGDAQVQMLIAVGSEKSAQKLQAALDGAKSSPSDTEKTKVLAQEVNNASTELKAVDLNAKMDKSKASNAVSLASLNFGGAALLDAWAVKDAQALSKDVSNAGMSAAMDLKPALTAAKFLLDILPGQISDMATLSKSLKDYATTNKIPLPSQKDMDKKAEDLKG